MTDSNHATRRAILQGAAASSALMGWGLVRSAETRPAGRAELFVFVEFSASAGSEDALRALLVPFAAASAKVPGCLEYTLMEYRSEPGRFVAFQRWTGQDALDAYMNGPLPADVLPRLENVLDQRVRTGILTAPRGS